MRTLKRFNSDMEIYSIDEAFLDLSNFLDQDVEKVGKEIRETVLQWTGIPTSIGIAKTKTLSKIANQIAKKKQSQYFLEQVLFKETMVTIQTQRQLIIQLQQTTVLR